jgi:hypothetical protein
MALTYRSGELVMKGDRVLFHGEPGEIEFIADAADPDSDWFVAEFGGGCMISAQGFGCVFIPSTADEEEVEFVSRGSE